MQKIVNVVGVVMLAFAVALGMFGCTHHPQNDDEPMVDFDFWGKSVNVGFLCEWHYPTTNGVSGYVEVCYGMTGDIQCYRIEGNHVTDYHTRGKHNLWWEIEKIIEPEIRKNHLPPQYREELESEDLNFHYQEKWRPHAMRELEALIRPFEVEGKGYVTMMAWQWVSVHPSTLKKGQENLDHCAVAVYPLNKIPQAVNALHDIVKANMADPSTREYHASYIRGCPVLYPERPNHIPVLQVRKYLRDFGYRQRDVLRFLPMGDRVLIPIEQGINPFKDFKMPYAPGNSLILNYRSKKEDWRWYLNGDNFWRIEVYGGNSD